MISDPSSDHASIPRVSHDGQGSDVIPTLTYKINQLKKQIEEDRILTVKEKHERNKKKVETQLSELLSISTSRKDVSVREDNSSGIMLSRKMESPLFQINSLFQGSGERDYANGEEIVLPTTTKLPLTERIPPYTTWIFLDKNQRMVEDQSVVGRRRIYYEQRGSEALICSDSEEEITEEEEKHLFTNVEDRILRMVVRDFELSDAVLQILTQYVGGTILEIQERCNFLKEKNEEMQDLNLKSSEESDLVGGISLDKSLTSALDSYDTIFCRRCLVFDCRLHGCSQTLIYPQSEKKPYSFDSGDDGKPCGDKCYLQLQGTGGLEESFGMGSKHRSESKRVKSSVSDAKGSDEVARTSETEVNPKSSASDKMEEIRDDKGEDVTEVEEERLSRRWDWKPFERELYLKGIEIFGRNSCLIARNLLPGLKTCMEVSRYMNAGGAAMTQSYFEEYGGTHAGHMDSDMAPRSRMLRKRGRTRKLKYSTKSAGHPLIWRRIVTGKNQTCHQYTPCECQSMCGKQCPCLLNGTCCEKYCGCIKNCKNRFRGCHCGKSQCKSRQCPCFAAGRECDPDVCKNCWVSCGDETMGEPPKQGEGQCGNMRLLLRQQQRILLAKSDVAGWGAFLKNSVNKNDYLGEYTGELISHREADKRGKIYDRANSSFLFDLNDEYVLDAYRKGDKLKFANHSANPNCYAKIMLVAGDHRVGIFAKERIEANEEIFYDYRYGPNEAPVWARKPEDSKRDASQGPQARARKHQSH